jgi:hypothetical protein
MSKVVYKISKLHLVDDLIESCEKNYSDSESTASQSLSIRDINDELASIDESESIEEEDDYEEQEPLQEEKIEQTTFVSPIRTSLFDGGDLTIRFLKETEIASPPLISAEKLKFRASRAPKVVQNMLRRMGFDVVKSKGWFGIS